MIIKDTIPAEWNVTTINNVAVGPVLDKDAPITNSDGLNGTYTVFRSGKDPQGKSSKGPKKNNSSTKICWTLDPGATGSVSLAVTVETRNSPSGKKDPEKHAPTSCGLLVLNLGATAFKYDTNTGELVVVAGSTAPLELVAAEDINGGGIVGDGTGDEDGDGLTDAEETLNNCTSPCDSGTDDDGLIDSLSDTDGDGLTDGDEVNIYGTLPCVSDTDGDGCDDGLDTNPLIPGPDADGDSVPDGCDICPGGDDNVDTDGDGVPDDCDT